MSRFALYSDIHGNIDALDAVLGDIAAAGISERYCLGDLVGYGPDPSAVIVRVRQTGDVVIRGNYDDGVGARRGECGCFYATPEAAEDGASSYVWTDAALDDAEHDWLASLPLEHRFVAEGVRVLLTHGSPRKINEYLLLDRPDHNLAKLAEIADAEVICLGHVHIPYHRVVELASGRVAHFISSGSVGKPKDGDPRACWVEVLIGPATADAVAGAASVAMCVHRVAYDIGAVAERLLVAGLPPRFAEALRNG